MNFGMKHSDLIRRLSTLDILDSYRPGWASPNPSESWPSLCIFSSVKELENDIGNREERVEHKTHEKQGKNFLAEEGNEKQRVKPGFYRLRRAGEVLAVEKRGDAE